MNIEQRSISSIQPYGKNAKKHPEKQINQIADSIRNFGFNQPIVVDKNSIIIVGHGRYFAANLIGMDEVPVLEIEITDEQARAYRLADNKLNESEWDMELVISELKTMSVASIDLSGFNRKLILDTWDREDDVPKLPEKPRTQVGDVYQLGRHKLVCGDSLDKGAFSRLMGEMKADMLFTDPPYNVNYSGKGENTSQGIMNDKMNDAEFRHFLIAAFANVKESVKAGAGLYVFHAAQTQRIFEEALQANQIDVIAQLIWNKPSAGLGMNAYRKKHEPFYYAGVRGSTPQFYGDHTNATVIDFQRSDEQLLKWAKAEKLAEQEGRTTIWTMKRAPVRDYVHPTQKPVELVMYALHNSSKVDDIVLDPFLGSGSTLIASEKTNRICYGMELDPKFADVIIERYCEFTGNRNIIKNGEEIIW